MIQIPDYSRLTLAQVDDRLRLLNELYGKGSIPEADYEVQATALYARQSDLRSYRDVRSVAQVATAPRLFSDMATPELISTPGSADRRRTLFPKRTYLPVKQDPQRKQRRRALWNYGYPKQWREAFTNAVGAVFNVVTGQVCLHRFCALSVREISDRSGVEFSQVKRALSYLVAERYLDRQQRPRQGQKHDTSIYAPAARTERGDELRRWVRDNGKRVVSALKSMCRKASELVEPIGAQIFAPSEKSLKLEGKIAELASALGLVSAAQEACISVPQGFSAKGHHGIDRSRVDQLRPEGRTTERNVE